MADSVITPLPGGLAGVSARRLSRLAGCIGFLVFSVLCVLATGLPMMILCRVGQGLTGGALIPTAMSTVLTPLPPSRPPMGLALFGFTAPFAPAIGPTIGGRLTVTHGRQVHFYVKHTSRPVP